MHVNEIPAARARNAAGVPWQVTAWREAPWWVLHVPGIGATQVRWLADAEYMARDLIACMLDLEPEDVAPVRVVRGIGPVQFPGSRSPRSWFWATASGLVDRKRRVAQDRAVVS